MASQQHPAKFQFNRNGKLLAILIGLSSLVSAQTASAGWGINTCDFGILPLTKGAFYAYYFNGYPPGYCLGAYSDSAQGACDNVRSQFINTFPDAVSYASYLTPANPASRIGDWGRCGFWGSLIQLRAPTNFIISLSGGSEVEPSKGSDKKTLPIIATVKDQSTGHPPTNPVTVHISLRVDPTSGGHDHGNSNRPRGGIAELAICPSDDTCWSHPTDSSGAVVFNFNPTETSGTHTITATCDGCSNTATKSVDVKVDGLSPIPVSPFYALNEANGDVIGARPGWHTDNHNLTHEAALKLVRIAVKYRFDPKFMVIVNTTTNQKDFPPVLHINDASLLWGGVYDICARPGACPDLGTLDWQEPHAEHRRGTVVDVRANGGDGSIPISDKAKFARLLINSGVPYLQESRGTSNEHFHLRLLGNRE